MFLRYPVPACGAVRVMGVTWRHMGYGEVGGYREGNTHPPGTLLEEGSPTQRSGPRKPQGAGVGGVGLDGRTGGWTGSWDHLLRRPGRYPCRVPPCPRTPRNAASWPNRARFDLNSMKYCQNGQVSLKSVEKAYHSPCFQKRVQNSPLEILRFPYIAAFSHKELMVPF